MLLEPTSRISVPLLGYRWNRDAALEPARQVTRRGQNPSSLAQASAAMPEEVGHIGPREGPDPRQDHVYDPFVEEPGLFLLFARLPAEPERIVQFADEYGCLSDPELTNWQTHLHQLHHSVDLWQGVVTRDSATLARHVEWTAGRLRIVSPLRISRALGNIRSWRLSIRRLQSRQTNYEAGDLYGPAVDLLTLMLSSRLTSILSIRGVAPAVITPVHQESDAFRLEVHLDSLEDVLWTQWISAVLNRSETQDCAQCGTPMLLTPQLTRSDRQYCSNACQMKAYRKRRKEAEQMLRMGIAITKVAKSVGTDVKQIKIWLTLLE